MTNETATFVAIKQEALPTKLIDIQKLIESAAIKGTSAQLDFQTAGCAIIQHLAKNKDIRVVRAFIAKIPESFRADSMTKWLELYAQVVVDDDDELHYDENKSCKLGLALEKPWWKAKPAVKYVPYNFVEDLNKVLERASTRYGKNCAQGTSRDDDITARDLNVLRSFIKEVGQTEYRLAKAA